MADFVLNYMKLLKLDTTPQATTRNFVRLAAGLSSAAPSNNETIDQSAYLDGDGFLSSDVTGAQRIWSITGHRDESDAAQNYIMSVQDTLGEDRKTNFREYDSKGNMRSGSVTICNVESDGGDASSKSEIGFELHFNGKPAYTAATIAPTANVRIDTGSVVGTTRLSLFKAAATNLIRYRLKGQTAGSINAMQYVPGLNEYDAGTLQSMSIACTTGAVTASGTITLTIEAACLTAGSDTVEVEVAEDDTPAQVMEKVKLACEAETTAGAVGAEFYIIRTDATLIFTAKSAAANDVTYDVDIVDTDTTGVVVGSKTDVDAGVVNADITASVGQYLQCFELDTDMRVVSFYEKALVSEDIAS